MRIELVDLSSYHNVTALDVNTPDGAGLHYDDISFVGPNGPVTITFGGFSYGTAITTQFESEGVIFNGGTIQDDWPLEGTWHVYQPPGGWSGTFHLDFTQPVDDLQFTTGWVDTAPPGKYATASVYTAILPPLTVSDANNTTDNVTAAATDAVMKDLYIGEDANGHAAIDLSALFEQLSANNNTEKVKITVQRSDGEMVFTQDVSPGDSTVDDLELPVTFTDTDFTVTLDNGQSGGSQTKEEIGVHVITLCADNNGDGAVNATDEALDLQQPVALNLEGDGARTEVVLSVDAPDGSGESWKVVLPAVPGVEFWTAPQGGSQLTPDADGNLIAKQLAPTRPVLRPGTVSRAPIPIPACLRNSRR